MTVVVLVVVGLLAGTMAAALGVGGGIVFVPALVVLLDFTQHVAQGTSLAVIIPTAVIATIVHARHGRVDWRAALPVAVGGAVGALVGAALALRLEDELLRRLFAILLIVLAIRMLLRARRLGADRAQLPLADGDIDGSG